MNYLFTSESVSAGHPDKVANQISRLKGVPTWEIYFLFFNTGNNVALYF